MRRLFVNSSGNALVVTIVVALVVILAGAGVFFFLNQEKGAMRVQNGTDTASGSENDDSEDEESTDEETEEDEDDVMSEVPDGEETESAVVVTFDGSKFSPKTVEVALGGKVTFKNESNRSFWPAVDPHPIHTNLPGFDSGESIGAGKSVTFSFNKVGSWAYHNHLSSSQKGVVVVKE